MILRPGVNLRVSLAALAVGLVFGTSELSWAEENIGGAKVVVNNIQGDLPTGQDVAVLQGDNVFLNEVVQSGADSKAKFLLKDNSDVTIGPGSKVTLDKFVYSGPKGSGTIILNLAKGTLRLAAGDASKPAYTVWTPTAAIGVRGTIVRVAVLPNGETVATSEEGRAIICPRSKGDNATVAELEKRRCKKGQELPTKKESVGKQSLGCGCKELNPGQQATTSPNGIEVTEAPPNAIPEPTIETAFTIPPVLVVVPVVGLILGGVIIENETHSALSP
jgi:hypothetical protein